MGNSNTLTNSVPVLLFTAATLCVNPIEAKSAEMINGKMCQTELVSDNTVRKYTTTDEDDYLNENYSFGERDLPNIDKADVDMFLFIQSNILSQKEADYEISSALNEYELLIGKKTPSKPRF